MWWRRSSGWDFDSHKETLREGSKLILLPDGRLCVGLQSCGPQGWKSRCAYLISAQQRARTGFYRNTAKS